MSESEIFVCRHCGEEHEALTQEIGSYQCPKLRKQQGKVKVLDKVMDKYLTEFNSSSETQDPNTNQSQDGDNLYGEEKISKPSTSRDSRTDGSENDNHRSGRESE